MYIISVSATISKRDAEHNFQCIICNNIIKNKDSNKHRFEYKESAQEFLNAVRFYADDVKTRLADIDNVELNS